MWSFKPPNVTIDFPLKQVYCMSSASLWKQTKLSALQAVSEECRTCRITRYSAGDYPRNLSSDTSARKQTHTPKTMHLSACTRMWGNSTFKMQSAKVTSGFDEIRCVVKWQLRYLALAKITFNRCTILIRLALWPGNTVIIYYEWRKTIENKHIAYGGEKKKYIRSSYYDHN